MELWVRMEDGHIFSIKMVVSIRAMTYGHAAWSLHNIEKSFQIPAGLSLAGHTISSRGVQDHVPGRGVPTGSIATYTIYGLRKMGCLEK